MATTAKKRPLPARSAKRKKFVPQSAQQTLPYRQMLEDGICHLGENRYTKTIQYGDINYSTESPENQSHIFDGYSGFLNYFDCAVPFQQSFVKRRTRPGDNGQVNIPPQDDPHNSIRREYVDMLERKVERSNKGFNLSRYVTYGISADGLKAARPRLERIEADILGNFKKLGVQAEALNGRDRLAVLHGQLHPGSREPFRFSWDMIPKTGLTTKDFIAPTSFDFKQSRVFRTGKVWGAVSYLQIMASELSDKMLAELLEVDAEMTITMHLQTVEQAEAIKKIKAKVSDIDKMKVEEQKKAVRSGYDMDILPPDLITYSRDAAALLGDLQSRNERLFLMTFLVLNTAPTRQQLENEVFQISGIAQKHNCAIKRLDFQQEQGFTSSLILGANSVEIQRGMTTSSVAIFMPFMTQELRMDGPSIYYGENALSHNVILADRKKLKNPNGLYLGVPGSGKSFAGKRELLNVFLATQNDRIIIVDVMGEYSALVRRLGGQVVELGPDSPHHINPCALSTKGMEDDNPLSLKADFLLSLCELIVADKQGLQPVERTVIDRCVRLMYQDHIANPGQKEMPLLQDLHALLEQQPEPEARRIATALELYTKGSLNTLNHPTNVDLNNRIVCFDLKKMGSMMRTIAMHTVNDFVTSQVSANFAEGIATWCYFDEFHVLLQDELTASYFVRIWKMLRKKYCIPSALTQNVKDLLTSTAIEALFENTTVYVLLAQAPGDRAIIANALGCSESQLAYVDNSNPGEGLLIFGDSIIPFVDNFPKNTEVYRLLTTRPEDLTHAEG